MLKKLIRPIHKDEKGITGLETAIILIAFVVVAAVFAYTVLSAGLFSTQKGQEAVYSGLEETQSTLELKGAVVAHGESELHDGNCWVNTNSTKVTTFQQDTANKATAPGSIKLVADADYSTTAEVICYHDLDVPVSLSSGDMDQIFQASQTVYTASAGFLQASVEVTPVAADDGATIQVNGTTVASGSPSAAIALAEGHNVITVAVTAEDGNTTETYSVIVLREYAAWFAQQAFLKASNAEGEGVYPFPDYGDKFGNSVAIAGDTLGVGALGEESNAGAAYVFVRSDGVWGQQAFLKASNTEGGDQFGNSVAIANGTVVVGARDEDSSVVGGEADNSASGAGAAYVWQ